MEDIEEQELNSNVSNNEIVNETSQSQPPDNFDKGMFLEEVRKYRCLWDINNESYKIRPVKQNAWLQIASVFNRDGKHCTQYLRPFFKTERHLCTVLAVLIFKNFFARTKFRLWKTITRSREIFRLRQKSLRAKKFASGKPA